MGIEVNDYPGHDEYQPRLRCDQTSHSFREHEQHEIPFHPPDVPFESRSPLTAQSFDTPSAVTHSPGSNYHCLEQRHGTLPLPWCANTQSNTKRRCGAFEGRGFQLAKINPMEVLVPTRMVLSVAGQSVLKTLTLPH